MATQTKTLYLSGLAFFIPLHKFRTTDKVGFYIVPEMIEGLSSIDQVRHEAGAVSPTCRDSSTEKPWYMHTHQEDNLLVYQGIRLVDLYSKQHGQVETFEVTPDSVKHQGNIIFEKPGIFGWPEHVFHRVQSPHGSISTNFAKHQAGFDIQTNFNIYQLDEKTGEHTVLRKGSQDQK